jgi:hypothetical protein
MLKAASMAAWDWQAVSDWSAGQLKTTAGAAVTVNLLVHIFVTSQELV